MTTNAAHDDISWPELVISEADYDLIANLALSIERRSPELARQLLQEIDRAAIVPAPSIPPDVVAIGSEVEFEDETNGSRRVVRLVSPGEADIEMGRISILTSVGAGLIGMAAGSRISWPRPDGTNRWLRIMRVNRPPAE
jgi:regulator of nucleoside diphosphate kinase